jgi:hypothetical protein
MSDPFHHKTLDMPLVRWHIDCIDELRCQVFVWRNEHTKDQKIYACDARFMSLHGIGSLGRTFSSFIISICCYLYCVV